MGDEDVAHLAQRRFGGLLGDVCQRSADQVLEQAISRGGRDQERDHSPEPPFDLEEHAHHPPALVVERVGHERRVHTLRGEQPHGRNPHPTGSPEHRGECVRGVARADARQLADAVHVFRVDVVRRLGHASWFRSRRNTGDPSPSTVSPASVRALARSLGTGLT